MKITYEPKNPDKLASSLLLKAGKKEATVSALELRHFRTVAERLGIVIEPAK